MRRTGIGTALGLVAAIVAIVWTAVVLDPLGAATIDPDASSSVLYFQHLVDGASLEAFVPTTPKPLLTLVFGVTWSLLHDWRTLVWETILVWGVAVGATAALVARVAGIVVERGEDVRERDDDARRASDAPVVAAAAFATAALLASSDLLLEVSRANSLVWALAGWAIAGLAVAGSRARPRLAGLALLFASLCRFETFALTALAVVAVVLWRSASRRNAGRLVPGIAESGEHFRARVALVQGQPFRAAAAGVAVALLAIPLVLLHDWLLTGDPFYWLFVPSRYTAIYNPGLAPIPPVAYAGTLVGRLGPEWPLLILAVVGVVAMARARRWLVLGGVAAVGLGVVALLFWLAVRATYISNRYYEPIDLALVVAAAVGVGWLVGVVVQSMRGAAPRALATAAAGFGVVAGAAVVWPALPWDHRATTELTTVRQASANASELAGYVDSLRANVVTEPVAAEHGPVPPSRPPTSFGLLVPSRDVTRLAVEANLGLHVIGDLYAALLPAGVDGLRTGQWVIHDAAADRPVALFKAFEVDAPTGRVEPASGTSIVGVWIDRIRP